MHIGIYGRNITAKCYMPHVLLPLAHGVIKLVKMSSAVVMLGALRLKFLSAIFTSLMHLRM